MSNNIDLIITVFVINFLIFLCTYFFVLRLSSPKLLKKMLKKNDYELIEILNEEKFEYNPFLQNNEQLVTQKVLIKKLHYTSFFKVKVKINNQFEIKYVQIKLTFFKGYQIKIK